MSSRLAAAAAAAGAIALGVYLHRRRGRELGATSTELTEIRRCDYAPPPYLVPRVSLVLKLDEPGESASRARATTVVEATLALEVNPVNGPVPFAEPPNDLVLNAERLDLLEVSVNGRRLEMSEFALDAQAETLTVRASALKAVCTLRTVVAIDPAANLELAGLYRSSGIFCTQMEAEGYRRMTPHLDRPDVLSTYTCRLEADAAEVPVLLSNGNRVASGSLAGGRHYATYEDPWPKPSYLFAAVAGQLGSISDGFTTRSGRKVALRIYTEPHAVGQLDFAMASIKKAMAWDEEHFGREYDLDVFNIVAVADFNMGAMENKGLNVFNSKLVLSSPSTATDALMVRVQGIIAHEYFHNWSGNRVTCRDWFQLTLKEGLTVYRDIRFTSDATDPTIKRIEDVRAMRQVQFCEDAGPMAHPIRPDAYVKMDNFYSRTVYRKGAEVIRMYETLLGRQGFRKGTDLYFSRHDGQAVTCDDFRLAMADANETYPYIGSSAIRTDTFGRWYSQAGTPTLTVKRTGLGEKTNRFALSLVQSTPPTPGQPEKRPLLLPVALGLLGPGGKPMRLRIHGNGRNAWQETMLILFEEGSRTYDIEVESDAERGSGEQCAPSTIARCTPSILRGWSAPCILRYDGQTEADLALLMAHDTDGFNRFEAATRFATRVLVGAVHAIRTGARPDSLEFDQRYVAAWGAVLDAAPAFAKAGTQHLQAMMLTLPADVEVLNELQTYDAASVAAAKTALRAALAASQAAKLLPAYAKARLDPKAPHELSAEHVGRRALAAALLGFAAALGTPEAHGALTEHYFEATNMSDQSAALSLLASTECEGRERALAHFDEAWRDHREVIDAWFTSQACSSLPNPAARLKKLMTHPAFSLTNPNKVRAVLGVLGTSAPHVLFRPDVLALLGEVICKVDATNGNLAASLCKMLQGWKSLPAPLDSKARAVLQQAARRRGCSKFVAEVVATALR